MNVIAFPGVPPTGQQVLETVYKFNAERPAWRLELRHGEDDGQPYVVATHSISETVLGFHWRPGIWTVTNANLRALQESGSLDELMTNHLR